MSDAEAWSGPAVRQPAARSVLLSVPEHDRRAQIRARNREAIVRAAVEHIRLTPGQRITTDDLADVADVAKRTLFNHFPGLEPVIAEAMSRLFLDDVGGLRYLVLPRRVESDPAALRDVITGPRVRAAASRSVARVRQVSSASHLNVVAMTQLAAVATADTISTALRDGDSPAARVREARFASLALLALRVPTNEARPNDDWAESVAQLLGTTH